MRGAPRRERRKDDHRARQTDPNQSRAPKRTPQLRRVGENNRITYKGPKQGGPTKTRTELEIGLEAGTAAAETFCQLVQALGYRPVAVVRKQPPGMRSCSW